MMWIRSQNKTRLLKAECVEYYSKLEQITEEMKDKKGKPIYIAGRPAKQIVEEKTYHCIYVNEKQYGTYSTKAKALKVLDMIQDFIGVNDKFQIPQDNEVEV